MKQINIIRKIKSFFKHCKLNIDYWFLKGNNEKKIIILSILFIISALNGIIAYYQYNYSKNFEKVEILDDSEINWDKFRNYGVVIDAGSSGSRVQIYSWRDTNYLQAALFQHNLTFSQLSGINEDGLPLIEKGLREGDNWQYKINRGISTFQDTPSDVGPKHIKLLIDPILNIVPAEKVSSTPIYIYATAGMRLLPEDKRKAILSETCSYLKENYDFLVDCSKQILNISGKEEGLYGWLGLNYLKNGFSSSAISHNKINGKNILLSYGVLDMGGASTQIAYDVSQFIKGSLKNEESIISTDLHKIDGQKTTYNVFSTTFLGFGMNETRRRYLEALVKKGIDYVLNNFDLKKNDKKYLNVHNNDNNNINIRRSNTKSPLPESNQENRLSKGASSKSPIPESFQEIKLSFSTISKSPLPKNSFNIEKDLKPMSNENNSKTIINKEDNKNEENNNDDDDDNNKNDETIINEEKKIIKENGLNGEFNIKLDKNTSDKYYELIIDDPCIPVDAKQNEFKPIDMVALEKDYDISDWRIDIKGTGDFEQCLTDLYPLLNKTVPCEKEPCLFNGVHSPVTDFSNMPFFGISEYWYTSHDVHKQGGVYNYDKFYSAAKELCKTNWLNLDKNYKNGNYPLIYDEYLLFLSCFRSAWIMTVLHEGIGISKNPSFKKRDFMDFNNLIYNTDNSGLTNENDILSNKKKRNNVVKNNEEEETNKEVLVPFTSINKYKGYEVSWTLGVILNYICSTINESLDNINFGNNKKFTLTVFFFSTISIITFIIIIALILYSKYGGKHLQYTEILPIYDDNSNNKFKNRYREVISLDNITSNTLNYKPTENFTSMKPNTKITNIKTNELPFRVSSDLQQYLSGQGTPNELKRVNSFTAMKKDHEVV